MCRLCLLVPFWLLLAAAAPPVEFVPVSPREQGAADEYRRIWQAEGDRIVAAMEAATGLAFPAGAVEAIVTPGPPMTSYDGRTIRLKANYPSDYKRATLVHELGHRFALALPRRDGLDDHRLLYLFLYDVWTDLYGRAFADDMVRIERQIPGGYDYAAAWEWALGQSREQRRARLAALVARPKLELRIEELLAGLRAPTPGAPERRSVGNRRP